MYFVLVFHRLNHLICPSLCLQLQQQNSQQPFHFAIHQFSSSSSIHVGWACAYTTGTRRESLQRARFAEKENEEIVGLRVEERGKMWQTIRNAGRRSGYRPQPRRWRRLRRRHRRVRPASDVHALSFLPSFIQSFTSRLSSSQSLFLAQCIVPASTWAKSL